MRPSLRGVRIVSLLPSATEILFAIGAGDDVVGVTFECDFPAAARGRPVVSSTTLPAGLTPAEIDAEVRARLAAGDDLYSLDAGALHALDPQLVVTQDLCAVCAIDVAGVDEALAHLGCRAEVLTVDPMTLSEVLTSIVTIGKATGNEARAAAVVDALHERLERVADAVRARARPRVAVLEWPDPPFSAGHWIPDMVTAAGAESVLGERGERSRRVEWSDIADGRPDLIVVAPCGYRLDTAAELALDLCRARRLPDDIPVWAVDADAAFVRPGPRLVDGVEALAAIAHPGAVAAPDGLSRRVT